MDHHCPWVNNCVGETNQKFFVLFTMYISLISLHALMMVGFHFLYCFEEDWTKCSSFSPPTTVILLILLCFEGLLFLIFTAVMFGTQVHSICTDETGIEQLKKEERRWTKKTKWMNLKAVFGHPFSIAWLSPLATPDQGKADPYQYVVWGFLCQLCRTERHHITSIYQLDIECSYKNTIYSIFMAESYCWEEAANIQQLCLLLFSGTMIIFPLFLGFLHDNTMIVFPCLFTTSSSANQSDFTCHHLP